jgi:XTP/dITP diphosphohydrolase
VNPRTILLATRSEGKLREIRALFESSGLHAVDLDDAGFAPHPAERDLETFPTFEENALAKARHFFARSGIPTIADDSGLSVHSLGGAPGVRSKRWSGRDDLAGQALDDENNRLLLEALAGVPDRSAHYVCAAAYVDATNEIVERGEVEGRIVEVRQGGGGFGYDPLFFADELGRTFGEVTRDEKARVSHRARAFRHLLARIR